MQNLIAFFQRFKIFIVFVIFQFFALWAFFGLNSFPRAFAYNKTSLLFASWHQRQQKYIDYFQLHSINEKLLYENAKLLQEIQVLHSLVDTSALDSGFINKFSSYQFQPAKVIHSTHDKQNNYLVLNKGKKHGIIPKMGVITGNGIVGITYFTSENFTIVKSVLTKNINISVYIDGIAAHGLLKYLDIEPKQISLTGISNDIPLRRGLKILTRGSSGYFPKGIEVGQIDVIEEIEGKPLWDLKIRLGQDMRRVHNVFVISNDKQDELNTVLERIEDNQ
jgi:rod shape-determining protein MreC